MVGGVECILDRRLERGGGGRSVGGVGGATRGTRIIH